MIPSMLDWLARSWVDWFGDVPGELHTGFLAGGPAHRSRVSAFVFNRSEREPRLFVKVALSARESRYVRDEFRAVEALTGHSSEVSKLPPSPLGVMADEGWLAAAYEVVPGRRLLVPQLHGRIGPIGRRELSRFWNGAARVGTDLAAVENGAHRDERALGEVVAEFGRLYDVAGREAAHLRAFRARLERERVRWNPSWQHGDVAVGNVLIDNGELRLVDWEAASPDYEPWFDLATAPVAAAILASRQTGCPVMEAVTSVLPEESWVGRNLTSTMRRYWRWEIPIGWAVALTCMRMAIRRSAQGRTMASDYGTLAMSLIADRSVFARVEWADL